MVRFFVRCGLALAILFLFSSVVAAAQVPLSVQSTMGKRLANDVTVRIEMGYQMVYRTNYWTPVRVSMSNSGADFKGRLTVHVFTGPPHSDIVSVVSPWSFEQGVMLGRGMQKQVTVYAPFSLGNLIPMGYVATVRDEQGRVVAEQTIPRGYSVTTGDLFIGVLSDHTIDSFNALSGVVLPHQSNSLTLSQLDASTLPDNAAILKVFDILLLDDFDSRTLSRQQLTALQTWVNQGGVLIEMGGSAWQRTLGGLPNELLPVKVDGVRTLAAGTPLLPIDSTLITAAGGQTLSRNTVAASIEASTATEHTQDAFNAFNESKTLLASGTTPLIVQARQGQGAICYLAFDLANSPLVDWDGTSLLWKTLLLNTLGDRIIISANTAISYDVGQGQLLTQGGILNMVVPDRLVEPGIVLLLLFGYVLMLGPIRIFITRRWKLPMLWTWRILALSVLGFSLLTYGMAAYQRNVLLIDNTLSLVQLTQSGSSAHIVTYHGVFAPDQGNLTLHTASRSLVLPLSSPLLARVPLPGPKEDQPATIVTGENGTTLTILDTPRWSFHPVVAEQDAHMQGAITPHLTLRNNRLVGTISNTLNTALSDIYVVLPHSFVAIGHIGAGETQRIDLPLHTVPLQSGKGLTDAIAQEGGLPAPYFPYTRSEQPQSDFQRHMALLSALNGAGLTVLPCNGPCNRNALTMQNSIILTGASSGNASLGNSYDPLLIAGAPATLIGWADQQLAGADSMTVNGKNPNGRHESFVRMPLSIELNSAADIPTGFIVGHAIDLPDSTAQLTQPGVYSLSASSMLFEFTLPGSAQERARGVTIKTPMPAGAPGAQGASPLIQASLYNWQSGHWDILTQTQGSFTIANTAVYIGKGGRVGRVLLQITNPNDAPGPLIFGKPSLIFNQ